MSETVIKSSPLVSVIINCYNGEKYLREAIDSVYCQTYTNWEIIFWDNYSNDKSAEIAKSYNYKLKYYKGDKNVPLGTARNLALDKVNGDFIAFLDADDLWNSKKLEKQIPLFANKEIGLVYCDVENFDEYGNKFTLYSKRKWYEGNCFPDLISDYFLSIQSVVLRTDIVRSNLITFDESLMVIEEAIFFCRICYITKVKYCNEILCKYRIHSESFSSKNPKLVISESKLFINIIQKYIPCVTKTYLKNVNELERKNIIAESKYYWKLNQRKKALSCLLQSLLYPKEFTLFILIVFMNYDTLYKILKIINYKIIHR